MAQATPRCWSQAGTKPSGPCSARSCCDGSLVCLGRGCGEGERNFAKTKFEHPVAAAGLAVVVALGRCPAQKLDLAVIEAEAAVDRRDLRLDRPFVRQQQACWAAFDDRRRDRRAIDVRKRLGGEDDGRILLAKRLQPLAKLAGKILVVEGKPTFIDNEKCGTAVETISNTMKQVGQHGRRRARSDQPFGLERLDGGLAKALEFGIKQASGRTAQAIGLQGAFQGVRLQED